MMEFHFSYFGNGIYYQTRAVHQTVINHMHGITWALMAKQDCQPMSYVSQRTLLLFTLHSLYCNLFLDRLDEIKWREVGHGCQEETGSFFWLSFGGYQGFWSGWEHPCHAERVNSLPIATKHVFVLWLTHHTYCCCWLYRCLNNKKPFHLVETYSRRHKVL